MAISVKLGERKVWKVNVGVASTDTRDHTKLENRDAADQHPINSISGLEKALSQKAAAQDLKGHVDNKQNPHGLTAEQVGARPSDWMPTAEQVGARPDNWMPSASEVGARPNTWLPTPEQIGAAPALDWSHLKWYVMGDSLTAQDNAFTDKRYYDFVQEKTGIQVIVDGVGATGYKAGEDEGQSFLDRVKNIPEDVDIVTIFGSGNDLKSTDTSFANNAIYDTLAWILLNRCGLRVIVVPPTPWRNYDKRGEVWKAYCDRLQLCALACDFRYLSEVYDCPPFNGKYDSHVEKFFTNDPNGVHPNEEGHKALAPYFYNALLEELALDSDVETPGGGGSGQNPDLTGVVKSVNGVVPDENGNVQIETGGVADEQVKDAVNAYLDEHPVDVSGVVKSVKGQMPDENGNVEFELPESGGIEVTGASVGQTIVVKAVDDNGKPTEWEAVNLPISGGSEEWDILANFTANEDVVSFATPEPPEGHTFDEYAEIVAFLFVTPNAGGFKSKIKFSLFDATAWNGTFNFSGLTGITDSAVSGRIGMMHIKKLPYGWMPICNYISYNEDTLNNILTPIKGGTVNESVILTYPPNSVPENMTAILPSKPVTVIAIGGYQAVIGAGSKAIVYGKRCS